MADILESLRRVLATDIEHHLLSTTVCVKPGSAPTFVIGPGPRIARRAAPERWEGGRGRPAPAHTAAAEIGRDLRVLVDKLGSIVDLVVDDEEQVLLVVVLSDVLVSVQYESNTFNLSTL